MLQHTCFFGGRFKDFRESVAVSRSAVQFCRGLERPKWEVQPTMQRTELKTALTAFQQAEPPMVAETDILGVVQGLRPGDVPCNTRVIRWR